LVRNSISEEIYCLKCGLVQNEQKKRVMKKERGGDRNHSIGKLALIILVLLIVGYAIFLDAMTDRTPPTITIISPQRKTYDICTIALTYTVNEPISWAGYSSNDAENVTLAGNTTLTNLLAGRYNVTIYANDTAGNMGSSRMSFTVTNVFSSLNELTEFVREDDLSDTEWTSNYTCVEFAEDFIRRAETKGYYCFAGYDLFDDEMDEFVHVVNSIEVVKTHSWGTETRQYTLPTVPSVGHAVCRTTVDGIDVIVDPQTDIILTVNNFTILYEGEITQD